MTTDQTLLFLLLGAVLVLLVHGRIRYDVVAFLALLVAVALGLVPTGAAFSGFGHPATVVVAMVLIVSRGLANSGAVDLIARRVTAVARGFTGHIAVMAGLSALLSAIMNNVGALALLMPVDLQAARRAKRPPGLTLMPLSFASILGGLVTLIGTPPNIIVAAFRDDALGAPFAMFDFTPVGAACAVAGVAFIVLGGWRLIPVPADTTAGATLDLEDYIAEARVPEGAPVIGRKVRALDPEAAEYEVNILGLVRRGQRLPGMARHAVIRSGDLLVISGGPEDIAGLTQGLGLRHAAVQEAKTGLLATDDVAVMEVVVPAGARVDGRSAMAVRLKHRFGVHLLGVSRQGRPFRERLRHLEIRAGDVLLLQGNANELPDIATRVLGCLPLEGREVPPDTPRRAGLAAGVFALAIVAAVTGLLYLPVALAFAAAGLVLLGIVPLREIYEQVEWPVIVLLGSMIPIGAALEATGGTVLIAGAILTVGGDWSPALVLLLLMVVTMTLSDVMNNTATAVIAAPVALDLARGLEVNPDPFLMAVAVAASCAFLTPIGHKNNTLIMGPGGYRFGDYWRMGLPLEVIVIAVAIPAILVVWPF